MEARSASVVVVSRHRPGFLKRCLLAIGQLDYPRFEVVVVACAAGSRVAEQAVMDVECVVIPFDTANIAQARNLGIGVSRGEVIAFIDDDAVPEPTWLSHLLAVFEDETVAQAGGTTLGRNGISVQHAASLVSLGGVSFAVPVSGVAPIVLTAQDNRYPRLHGTNMAFRKTVLSEHGGFDHRFAFYLDETDMTLRISRRRGKSVHVPMAVVHHANGASAVRRKDRTPRNLFEVGASAGVFVQKHLHEHDIEDAKRAFFMERDRWLLRHMQIGSLTPDDVLRLRGELRRGFETGRQRACELPVPFESVSSSNVIKTKDVDKRDLYLVSRPPNRAAVRARAMDLAQQGDRVTVFDLDATARYHTVRFHEDGYWLHRGGIFGRELRSEPVLQRATREERIKHTLSRIQGIRAKGEIFRADDAFRP